MIDPTDADIGRRVIYESRGSREGVISSDREIGVISSLNDVVVFVRYGLQIRGTPTSREDLEWEHETKS